MVITSVCETLLQGDNTHIFPKIEIVVCKYLKIRQISAYFSLF